MADKALRGNKLTRRLGIEEAGPRGRKGSKRKGYRVPSFSSPMAKSRVIERMKKEAKVLGGSFFTADEMEAKIKKMKKNGG